jgi:hypothetical protein
VYGTTLLERIRPKPRHWEQETVNPVRRSSAEENSMEDEQQYTEGDGSDIITIDSDADDDEDSGITPGA